jgi:hypothetical protein
MKVVLGFGLLFSALVPTLLVYQIQLRTSKFITHHIVFRCTRLLATGRKHFTYWTLLPFSLSEKSRKPAGLVPVVLGPGPELSSGLATKPGGRLNYDRAYRERTHQPPTIWQLILMIIPRYFYVLPDVM